MKTKQQQTLRTVAKFLFCLAHGAPVTLRDFKTMSDLCWLTLPMKYRMDKAELAEIQKQSWYKALIT